MDQNTIEAKGSANINPFNGEGLYVGIVEDAIKIERASKKDPTKKPYIRLLVRTSETVAECNYVHITCYGEAWEKFVSPRLRRRGIEAASFEALTDADLAKLVGLGAIIEQTTVETDEGDFIRHGFKEFVFAKAVSVDDATEAARTTYRPLVGDIGLITVDHEAQNGPFIKAYVTVKGYGLMEAWRCAKNGAGPIALGLLARAGIKVDKVEDITNEALGALRGRRAIVKRVQGEKRIFHDLDAIAAK